MNLKPEHAGNVGAPGFSTRYLLNATSLDGKFMLT